MMINQFIVFSLPDIYTHLREIKQLENNLSFFSISNKNNPLVLNVKNQVNEFKEELAVWKEKLDYIKKLDY